MERILKLLFNGIRFIFFFKFCFKTEMIFPKCERINLREDELDYWSNCFYIEFILKFEESQTGNSFKTFFFVVKFYLHCSNILTGVDHSFWKIQC